MIAKKRVGDALEQLAARDVQVTVEFNWIPFMLNPKLPMHGVSLAQYYQNQYGASRNPAMELPNLNQMEPSIHWKVYEPSSEPNVGTTLHAHRLVHWATRRFGSSAGTKVMDRLNQLYFVEGKLLSDYNNLRQVARDVKLDASEAEVREYLESDEDCTHITREDQRIKSSGNIWGVPHMVARAGAQEKGLQLGDSEEIAIFLEEMATGSRVSCGNGPCSLQ